MCWNEEEKKCQNSKYHINIVRSVDIAIYANTYRNIIVLSFFFVKGIESLPIVVLARFI